MEGAVPMQRMAGSAESDITDSVNATLPEAAILARRGIFRFGYKTAPFDTGRAK